jgi:hypothetical protein
MPYNNIPMIKKYNFRFFFIISLFANIFITNSKNYYLSSTSGNDTFTGTNTKPWKSLTKINTVTLLPGDTVFFNKGDSFFGHLVPKGSGTITNPIVLSAYGAGNKPIISGQVGSAGGGDYQEAILIQNQDNYVVDGLEIQNERMTSRVISDSTLSFGIYIYNSGTKVMRNFTIRNSAFRNIYAVKPLLSEEDFNSLKVAGIRVSSTKNTIAGSEKHVRDVLIENCYFTDLQRFGIHFTHDGGNTGIGNDSINRNMNLVVRNNSFYYTGGTCVLPSMAYNTLIENNNFDHPGASTDPRMPARGSAVWTWRCFNSVIQKNQCLHIRGYLDSHGIHIDHQNVNTFIQYNYMKDCEGGFVEILGGNLNSVYRFNISENDGWRVNPGWDNSNHTIWISQYISNQVVSYSDSSYIYNNTIYIDSTYSTSIAINAKNTFIYNNIFYTKGGANIGGKEVNINNNGTNLYMRNNLFYGTIATTFTTKDTNKKTGNPLLNNPKTNQFGYQLMLGSAAINAGVAKTGPIFPLAGKGIFKNIPSYPTEDYYGNPVNLSSGTPNIGVCNDKNGNISSDTFSIDLKPEKEARVYFDPASSNLVIKFEKSIDNINVNVFNIESKALTTNRKLSKSANGTFMLYMNTGISKGVYIVKIDTGESQFAKRFIVTN